MPLRRLTLGLMPFAALSALYAWGIWAGRDTHLHLHDGTFSLGASWWITLPHSFLRLFWPWGAIGAAVLVAVRKFDRRLMVIAALWMVVGLAPYSFLLYMNRVPSRHTYLAGVGVTFIAAAAYHALRQRQGRRQYGLSTAFALALLIQNSTYLWVKKLPQFEQRASVSERFLDYARQHRGAIRVRCYPGSAWTAKHAVNVLWGRSLDSVIDATSETGPVDASDYCDTSPF